MQSLKRNEILNFPSSGERDLIKFLRFKFGIGDLEAGNILEQMRGVNNEDSSIARSIEDELQIYKGNFNL